METTVKLTGDRVLEILQDCLFREGEPTTNFVKGEGVRLQFGFHPERLAGHKEEIGKLLAELPEAFHSTGGGGMSFLNACEDRHGNHWAEHQTIDWLLCLGLATGQASYCMPRELWAAFPGGMPYFVVSR